MKYLLMFLLMTAQVFAQSDTKAVRSCSTGGVGQIVMYDPAYGLRYVTNSGLTVSSITNTISNGLYFVTFSEGNTNGIAATSHVVHIYFKTNYLTSFSETDPAFTNWLVTNTIIATSTNFAHIDTTNEVSQWAKWPATQNIHGGGNSMTWLYGITDDLNRQRAVWQTGFLYDLNENDVIGLDEHVLKGPVSAPSLNWWDLSLQLGPWSLAPEAIGTASSNVASYGQVQTSTNNLQDQLNTLNGQTGVVTWVVANSNSLASTNLFAGPGSNGLAASTAGDVAKFLKGDGTWDTPAGGSASIGTLRQEVDDIRYQLAMESFNQYGYRISQSYGTPYGYTSYFENSNDISSASSNVNQFSRLVTVGGTGSNLITWTTARPTIPTALRLGSATTLGNNLYLVGGLASTVTASVTRYNEASNAWTSVASLPNPRLSHGAFELGGDMYICGGRTNSTANTGVKTCLRYSELSNVWVSVADMPSTRYYPAGASLNGFGYLAGGSTNTGDPVSSVFRYNPVSNVWDTVAALPSARSLLAMTDLGGNLYALCGSFSSVLAGSTGSVYRYSQVSNVWTTLENYPINIGAYDNALTLNGQIYVVGGVGIDGVYVSSVYRYNESLDTWTSVANLPVTIGQAGGYSVLNGKLYQVGGIDNTATLRNVVQCTLPQSMVGGSMISKGLPLTFSANRAQLVQYLENVNTVTAATNYGPAVYGTDWSNSVSMDGGTTWSNVTMLPAASYGSTNIWYCTATNGITGTNLAMKVDVTTNCFMMMRAWQRMGGQQ